jgi:hypothetical protein
VLFRSSVALRVASIEAGESDDVQMMSKTTWTRSLAVPKSILRTSVQLTR